ncbi:MAG: hypothetical protein IPM46_14345 [Flavobacteriales bacterium]|nr:hypothetical protein [Flavobacteriales bacterium]
MRNLTIVPLTPATLAAAAPPAHAPRCAPAGHAPAPICARAAGTTWAPSPLVGVRAAPRAHRHARASGGAYAPTWDWDRAGAQRCCAGWRSRVPRRAGRRGGAGTEGFRRLKQGFVPELELRAYSGGCFLQATRDVVRPLEPHHLLALLHLDRRASGEDQRLAARAPLPGQRMGR